MGKASRWFRTVLGLKKPDHPLPEDKQRPKEKRRWSFVKSYREKDHHQHQRRHDAAPPKTGVSFEDEEDPCKYACAVAAAKAQVMEKAKTAAQAAAEVVRLASNSATYVSGRLGLREYLAAVKIQAAFRSYLARRALRALKALVRLQALVRGHIERKRTAEWLQRMHSLLRAQARARARARAGRAPISESSHASCKSSHFLHPGPPTPEKYEIRTKTGRSQSLPSVLKRSGSKTNGRAIGDLEKPHVSFNWSERRMDEQSLEHQVSLPRSGTTETEISDKILEIDNGKPHFTPRRRNPFHFSHNAIPSDQYSHSFTTSKDSTTHQTFPSPSSGGEIQSSSPLKLSEDVDEVFCTAENSPQFGGIGRSPFTPTKSDSSRSFLSGYSDYPNYMSYTESSRAKVRSVSAPKQRPQYERSASAKRYSVIGYGEPRSSSAQRASSLHASFTSRAYPGSGRLDRLGMPIGLRY
ncbi:hypothetical protein K2173_018147 [Erythroxylum novogranatense]|uniref:DUF4005 domain-containing protein n=1 Tax=Erythroxylum novogranatense TaxID=1862640 RepID=A0AAV8TN74_9ROSI|nr:hypothetical protein K2173_018147 [Erythroxylum novogranatense]